MKHRTHWHPLPRVALVLLALPLAACGTNVGNPPKSQQQTHHVETHPSQGDVRVIEGAEATLISTPQGAYVSVTTSELTPGNAYTLWFVAINNPSACENNPCNANDVLKRTEMTKADVGYGDGLVVGPDGNGHFTAYRPVGALPQAWLGTGFYNPMGAEIHLVVHDHGPLRQDLAASQISTYRGGCRDDTLPDIVPASAKADGESGPNSCKLVQDAIFIQ